ncbi:MAG TPA: response regulator [Candidatus Eisenbacteria bacterium]|nr:response regulator [Candidatus Eisenbacteria bacterium]
MTRSDTHARGVPAPASAAEPGAADAARPGGAARFLASGLDTRRESRRILVGAAALLVLTVVIANLWMWQTDARRVGADAWGRLESGTVARRDEIRQMLDAFRREAASIAHDPGLAADAGAVAAGAGGAGRARLIAGLRARADEFEFGTVQLFQPGRGLVCATGEAPPRELTRDALLAAEAAATGQVTLGDPRRDALAIAVPLAHAPGGRGAVLVVHTDAARALKPFLAGWPGLGDRSGAFLVRAEGDEVVILTAPADGTGLRQGMRLPVALPEAMAAAMAATGVESRVEIPAGDQRPAWAVTRALPGYGWGVVGQADRADLLAAMEATRQRLVLIDVMLALAMLAALVLVRRYHRGDLARREAEVTERHARRVQGIFDTAFDAIITFAPDGRVRSANRAAEALFGRPFADIDGQPVQRMLRWGASRELPAPGTVGTGEALQAGGLRVPVEFTLGRTGGGGEEELLTAIVRDIRERVAAENRIKAFAEGLEVSNRRLEEMNAQLEEASRLKSEFLANTSHELRTPLNGMIGFLQLVLDGMCDSPEEERDFLKQALHCSRHLLGLINDVLDIAKIEAGKLTLEIDRIDVSQLFDEVRTVTHVQAAQRGVELKFEAKVEPDVRARGDFHKVKQVLINLVGNSLKFTPRGSITVRAVSHADLGHVMIDVVDTGIGIPADRQKLIFEKFVQADGSTTRRFGGTGLGLAISRSLVELMGGIIGVHSDGEGRGTRMYFSLPVWRDESPAVPNEHGEASERIEGPAGGALVLVVEDDPVFRRFLTAVLQQHGYRTVEADHAEAGWVLVRRLRPAVVVLDYALSCGDNAALRTGWDLAKRMTGEAETRHIPVVFVTGFDGEVKEKLRATAFARRPEHLVKPIEAQVLVAKIQELAGAVHGRQVRILMADDDPTVAAYVQKVLPAERFQIEVANDGEECLHILRTQPHAFDLLLLDLMMPEVSGYDVLRELTLNGLRPDLPVLVLTNFPEARNEEERLLLEQGLVLDVVAKTAVHDNPQLLPHVLDWHLQVAHEQPPGDEPPGPWREAA